MTNPIGHHLERHGGVHATWIIAVLTAIIAALLLRLPNGNSVGDYIAFAASIASLVLAVVAIGQSLIANQSLSTTVGSLNTASSNLERASENLEDISKGLETRFEEIAGEVARMPVAVAQLEAKITGTMPQQPAQETGVGKDRFDTGATLTRSEGVEEAQTTLSTLKGLKNGSQVALYVLAQSYRTQKAFNSTDMFTPDSELTMEHFRNWIYSG